MGRLDGETILVTGASRGLGASMATRFAVEGANVVLTARSRDELEAVAADADGSTLVAPADVTDETDVRTVIEAAVDRYGAVTGLVNNAAIGLLNLYDEGSALTDVDTADFRRILNVNVTGVFLCSKHTVPAIRDAGGGNVINISSGLGRRAAAGWGPYVASKWALEGLTRVQAIELGPAINVNALDPGGRTETGFWDHLPAAEREEIREPDVMDDAATALLAQDSDGVSGESMPAEEWEHRLEAA